MQLSFRIKKTKDIVFDYLTDMQKFASVHPVITKIVQTNNNNYLVYETLKLGFLSFSFTYPISVESNSIENLVIMRAVVMKFTKIEITIRIKPDTEFPNEFTIIEENITFKSLLPIKPIAGNIFRKIHTQLFKNIEEIL